MSIELPPLRRYDLCLRGYESYMKRAYDGGYCDDGDREARERILLARIAELEADAERYRWLSKQHNGPWLTEDGEFDTLDAAIDAARGAK